MSSEDMFPVAGIGSSAGGVEALQALFQNMPADTGMAFILVSHLARDYQSVLPEIVGRHTTMPVKTAQDGAAIEPNVVYVCPPNYILTVQNGKMRLTPRASTQQHKPIDVFLSSLAEGFGEAAIGILLSGSGSDGALGIKSVKEHGGLTVAQGSDGGGPMYSEMPDAAIASGVVDIIAPVEDMPARLADYAHSFRLMESKAAEDAERGAGDGRVERYQPIYRRLLAQVGHDFSGYKEKTFTRRVRRRMQVVGLTRLEDYIARTQEDPEEVTLLFRDLLISVTNFFRDPEAFEGLEQLVVPRLLEGKRPADTVRIWCPGCATGEEVYSIAILMREHMDAMPTPPKVQIFATDIDEPALAVARAGRYPESMLDNVSAQRRDRFFVSDDVSYVVLKEIRDMCIFSPHSVIRDPPFSRIDLISCRNLLIYLGSTFQSQVVPVFHFALRERGFLFLGNSENVTQYSDLFAPMEKKQRIFQRRDHAVAPLRFPFFLPHSRGFPSARDLRQEPPNVTTALRHAVETRVLERFAPAHVVVNAEGDILHFSPRTGKYLEPASGLPNRQLLAMARRGLRLDLRAALKEALATRAPVQREHVEVELDDRKQFIDLSIEPFGSQEDPLFLILFSDVGLPSTRWASEPAAAQPPQAYDRLEQELRDNRERLQSTIEEYETAVEELKSSNEELQSINEELQSTNEELETAREELQSVNEELHTVNAELNSKVDEADRAHADLRNVFDSTQIATIFLDSDLRIRSFTPAVTSVFNLISSDWGRPLSDIVSSLDDRDLGRDIQVVLERGEMIERNVRRTGHGDSYLMRILPYRRRNIIDGVIIVFVDVSKMVEAEAHQRTLVEELNHRVRNMLTVVNSIASQTMATSDTPREFIDAFGGRIHAMGTAYGLVSHESWGDVSLRAIVTEQLKPFEAQAGGRIEIDGPDVVFKPNASLALGMVIHELATNAAKHGALSTPKGRLSVTWTVEHASPPCLIVHWSEKGGPAAKSPSRKGFGTKLIRRELEQTLRAKAKFEFGRSGLRGEIAIPLDDRVLAVREQSP